MPAIAWVDGHAVDRPRYVCEPFTPEPEPGAASVNFRIDSLSARARVT